MQLKIIGIRSSGSISDERVVLKAEGDGDIGRYMTFVATRLRPQTISARLENPFWLPEFQVKNNDLIIVYTKEGRMSTVNNSDRSQSHFFYRGEKDSLFGSKEKVPMIVEIVHWSTSEVRY